MTCPSDERLRQFLDGGLVDPEVRELEQHLDACGSCGARFLSMAREVHSLTGQAPAGGLLSRGSSVGRFVVLEVLGRGAYGTVYSAYDPQLDRRLALKVVDAWTLSGPQQLDLVLREARATAKVSHPNVVAVHDAGLVGSIPFVAMELVPGQSLAQWLASPRRRAAIVEQFRAAGEGLAAAHAVGLAHGDFRADNVLIGEDGRVRVTDFGLSGSALASIENDVRAFCVALERALVQPDGAGVGRGRLRAIIARGLASAPGGYPSLRALLDDLQEPRRWVLSAGAIAVLTLAVAGWSLTRQTCERSPSALAGTWDAKVASEVDAAFSAVGGPYALSTAALVRRQLDAWREAWLDTELELCLTKSTTSPELRARGAACLQETKRHTAVLVDALRTPKRSTVSQAHTAIQALLPPRRCADERALLVEPLPADPEKREWLFERRLDALEARALKDVGRPMEAKERLEALLAADRSAAQPSLAALLHFELGGTLGRLNEHPRAVEQLDEAMRLGLVGHADDVAAHAGVLLVYERGAALHQPELAAALVPVVDALVTRLGDERLAAGLAVNRALVAEAGGHLTEALELQRKASEAFERVAADSPAHANALLNESRLLVLLGRPSEASPLVTQALATLEETRGPFHPNVAVALDVLAVIALDRGANDEARSLFEREREVLRSSLGPQHLHFALATDGLAQAVLAEGKVDDALLLAQASVEGATAATAPGSDALVDPLLTLADAQLQLGQLAEARSTLALVRGCAPSPDGQARARRALLEASVPGLPKPAAAALVAAGLETVRRGSQLERRLEGARATFSGP